MYRVRKTIEVAGAHSLCLNYDSPCQNLHGHNWLVTVELSSLELNENGMVIDFKDLKKLLTIVVHDKFDHKHINSSVVSFNPTAENISQYVANEINLRLASLHTGIKCTRVEVQESRDNVAIYEVQ